MILIIYRIRDRDIFIEVRENYPFRILHHSSEHLISKHADEEFRRMM